MITCYLKNWKWLLISILLLFLIMLLPFLGNQWRQVESDVLNRSQSAISTTNEFKNIKLSTKDLGRGLLISGSVNSEEAKSKILKITKNLVDERGNKVITNVDWNAEIIKPIVFTDPRFVLTRKNNQISLSGELANQNQINQLINGVQNKFKNSNIINNLKVGKHLNKIKDFNKYASSLNIQHGNVEFRGKNVTLRGQTFSTIAKQNIQRRTQQMLGPHYQINNQISIIKNSIQDEAVLAQMNRNSQECNVNIKDLLMTNQIKFKSGKADIDQLSYSLLDQIIVALKVCPQSAIEISGHTDSTGDADFNKALSERRAMAVMTYLINKNMNVAMIRAIGKGSSEPIANNETAEGRAKNRRIEFKTETIN